VTKAGPGANSFSRSRFVVSEVLETSRTNHEGKLLLFGGVVSVCGVYVERGVAPNVLSLDSISCPVKKVNTFFVLPVYPGLS